MLVTPNFLKKKRKKRKH